MRTDLATRITQTEEKINKINSRIADLTKKKRELDLTLRELRKKQNTKLLLESINSITKENSMWEILCYDVPTTPIMDEFANSDKQFLLLRLYHMFNYSNVWIVVSKFKGMVNYVNSNLTMTDLKKGVYEGYYDIRYFVNDEERKKPYITKRIFPLMEQLSLINPKNRDTPDYIIPFKTPCLLKGQTYANQTGYGSEYNGEELVYQGTLYGETTNFLIIGILGTGHPALQDYLRDSLDYGWY